MKKWTEFEAVNVIERAGCQNPRDPLSGIVISKKYYSAPAGGMSLRSWSAADYLKNFCGYLIITSFTQPKRKAAHSLGR